MDLECERAPRGQAKALTIPQTWARYPQSAAFFFFFKDLI